MGLTLLATCKCAAAVPPSLRGSVPRPLAVLAKWFCCTDLLWSTYYRYFPWTDELAILNYLCVPRLNKKNPIVLTEIQVSSCQSYNAPCGIRLEWDWNLNSWLRADSPSSHTCQDTIAAQATSGHSALPVQPHQTARKSLKHCLASFPFPAVTTWSALSDSHPVQDHSFLTSLKVSRGKERHPRWADCGRGRGVSASARSRGRGSLDVAPHAGTSTWCRRFSDV